MNRFFLALPLLLATCAIALGAVGSPTPTLTNFNAQQFRIDPHASAPTNLITLRLNSTQFDSVGDTGITLTNIHGIAGSTLWTNIGGTYQPNQVQHNLLATNIISYESLMSPGLFVMYPNVSTNLVAGTNNVLVESSHILVTGPSTNPATSFVSLSAGLGSGTVLILENYSTNSAFTLKAGSTNWDGSGSITLANGTWTPTIQGESIWLVRDGRGWKEVARPGAINIYTTNIYNSVVTTNMTVNNSFTVHGKSVFNDYVTINTNVYISNGYLIINGTNVATVNPTDLYVPYRIDENHFGDSSWKQVATNIIAEATYSRFGTLSALPNFSTKPILAVRSVLEPAITIDTLQPQNDSTFNLYSVVTNGSTGAAMYLQSASAGTIGTTARVLQIDAYAGTVAGTNSVLDNNVSGAVGIYANASSQGQTNTSNAGLVGTADGAGFWNEGVSGRATRNSFNAAGNFIGLHGKFSGTLGAAQHGAALFAETPLSTDSANAILGESGVIIADNRTSGLPLFIGRSGNGTTRLFYIAGTTGYTGTGTNFFGDDGSFHALSTAFPAVVTATKAFRSTHGTLTHAGTTTVNFDAANTVNYLSATGSITLAFSGLADGYTARLFVRNSQATNITLTLPAGVQGYYTTTLSNGCHMVSMESWGTVDTNVWVSTSSNGTY